MVVALHSKDGKLLDKKVTGMAVKSALTGFVRI